jgi:hypothetical protein
LRFTNDGLLQTSFEKGAQLLNFSKNNTSIVTIEVRGSIIGQTQAEDNTWYLEESSLFPYRIASKSRAA